MTVPAHGFAKVAIDSGIRFKPQQGTKPPFRAYFIDLDTKVEHFWGGAENWQSVPLPPGRYRLDWQEAQFGTERTTLLDELKSSPERSLNSRCEGDADSSVHNRGGGVFTLLA